MKSIMNALACERCAAGGVAFELLAGDDLNIEDKRAELVHGIAKVESGRNYDFERGKWMEVD